MNSITYLYTEVLWRPLFNGLVWFYTTLPWQDLGLAIIVLTLVIRLILSPLFLKMQKSQRDLAVLQPEIEKVQNQHKNNKGAQGKALMELYAEKKVNPFGGCLIILIQLPLLIALFQVFQKGFDPAQLSYLYSFVKNPGALNPVSFGLVDLSKGNLFFGVIAALSQFLQTKLSTAQAAPQPPAQGDFAKILRWQTLYLFPALIIIWSSSLPSALALYWTVLNTFGIIQETIMRRVWNKNV
ncbi:MAG: membrane protein insertase YidC [Candidatus Sungiibacteriota bacterium]|uniref:Membrane protein insertase YidC n=1 Tax=Candidatus Sungiibacteriota bacterium TaxID=2750080 RepID=A0A7T5RIS3_9BACT|nr:MAG: membrane protein insertase YidC [Candidatus Sungbacteria bacterium]